MRHSVLFLVALFSILPCTAQDNPREDRWIFWGYPQNYIENQARVAFASVEEVLEAFPPTVEYCAARRNALITLDMLLHDTANDKSAALMSFFERRFAAVADELEKSVAAGSNGIEIFKMYNDGFILRSPSATVAVDLIRGGGADGKHYTSDSTMRRIAACCDMLMITHNHGDHADMEVVSMFLEAGKEVFAPKEVVASANFDPASVKKVSLKILPGHQDSMPNNIYHITFAEGYSVAHTGDQYNAEDLNLISQIREKLKTDVLIVNCWTMELQKTIAGFNPSVVITGHENEMEHTIDHREAYWMTMKKMENSAWPYVMMSYGEKFKMTDSGI